MSALTPNEKCATFIGWKPNEKCQLNWMRCNHEARFSDLTTLRGMVSIKPHDIPAPDMTDPRNYMKALENVYPTGTRAINLRVQRQDAVLAAIGRALFNRDPNEIVGYLAALYELDHPEVLP